MNRDENAASREPSNLPTEAPAPVGSDQRPSEGLSKKDRVGLIFAELEAAPCPGSRESALSLLDQVFRNVENAHSGVPHDPYHVDRMYPPVAEMERAVQAQPWLRRYRHTGHVTLIADNGAIEVRRIERGIFNGLKAITGEKTIFEKPGADGRRISEME